MRERDEFEAWAKSEGLPLCMSMALTVADLRETNRAWDAWQAARAAQAVQALTDEQRVAAAKALVEVYLGFPAPDREPGDLDLRAVDAVASIILAAPQPSQEETK